MQRTVLQLIVLPYLSRSGPGRYFTATVGCCKTAANVDGGSGGGGSGVTGLYPPWSASPSGSITVRARRKLEEDGPAEARNGDFVESSMAAQNRARLLYVIPNPPSVATLQSSTHYRPSSISRTSSTKASSSRAVASSPAKAKTEPPDPPSNPPTLPDPQLTIRERTALEAIQKIVAIHTESSAYPRLSLPLPASSANTSHSPPPLATHSDTPQPISQAALQEATTKPTRTRTHTPAPVLPIPLPPSLHLLISRRQFRLAAFHLLNTPSLSANPAIIHRVSDILELKGAGNLAYRLRHSLDLPRREHPDFPEGKLRLASVPKDRGSQQEPGSEAETEAEISTTASSRPATFWEIPPMPPSLEHPQYPKRMSIQQRMTSHYNAQLSYFLHQSSHSPYGSLDSTYRPTRHNWPNANPRLLQLSKLLRSIDHLEKKHGFVPNRVTANIILSCWLHCGIGQLHRYSRSEPFYAFTDKNSGEERVRRKEASPAVLDARQIMLMFKIVSLVMERAMQNMELELQRLEGRIKDLKELLGRESRDKGDLDLKADKLVRKKLEEAIEAWDQPAVETLEWKSHVLPFSDMVKQALRKIGDGRENVKIVLSWEKRMKVRLAKWSSKRPLRREPTLRLEYEDGDM